MVMEKDAVSIRVCWCLELFIKSLTLQVQVFYNVKTLFLRKKLNTLFLGAAVAVFLLTFLMIACLSNRFDYKVECWKMSVRASCNQIFTMLHQTKSFVILSVTLIRIYKKKATNRHSWVIGISKWFDVWVFWSTGRSINWLSQTWAGARRPQLARVRFDPFCVPVPKLGFNLAHAGWCGCLESSYWLIDSLLYLLAGWPLGG